MFSLIILSWMAAAGAAESLRDPTQPLIDTHARGGKVESSPVSPGSKKNQLKGIIFNNSHRKAIIDGQLVAEGESINGFRVHQISAHKVVLRSGSTFKTLTLSPSVKTANK